MAKMPISVARPNDFETYADAKRRLAHKIRVLRKGDQPERRLATKLEQCHKGKYCGSGACDVCLGLNRLGLYQQTQPIFAQYPHWTRASVIPAGFLFSMGELENVDLNALRKMTDKRLERSTLRHRIVIAGIDISLNLQDNNIIGWQLHLYILIEGKNTLPLREAIQAAFPPEPTAPVPYKFDAVTDPSNRITYLLKAIFNRRSQYRTAKSQARTKSLPLKGPELRELLPFLDQYPIGARLILRGLRRNGRHLVIINKQRKAPT